MRVTAAVILLLGSGCAHRQPSPRALQVPRFESLVPRGMPLPAGQYRLSRGFIAPSNQDKGHKGIDLTAERGTPVLATAPGRVILSQFADGGYGEVILIEHAEGYETLYAHLGERLVREGDRVRRKQPIGRVGATGNATGPHLHYEVRRWGTPIDPLPFLSE